MRTLILTLALLLAAPVTASAASGLKPVAPGSGLKPVPPSNSAANQYVEVVPTAGGGAPATGVTQHTSSGGAPGSALPAQTRTALAGSGQDGQRIAQLTQATAPARVRTHGKRTKHAGAVVGSSGGSSGGGHGSSGSGSAAATPVSSVVKSLTGGGASGIGAGLPVALILVALGVSGVALARRHAA